MRTSFFIIFLILALLVAGFVGTLAYWTLQPPQSPVKDSPSVEGLSLTPTSPTRPVISSSDPVRGNPAAPLVIVEFGDFLCPACAEVEPMLRKVLEENPGKVKLIWKDLPNTRRHPLAQKAAEAARCAGEQGGFWPYHDLLLSQTEQGQSLTNEGLSLMARELQLNTSEFSQCLASDRTTGLVNRSFNEALLLRVDATPYFFIGDRRISIAVSEQTLQDILEQSIPL